MEVPNITGYNGAPYSLLDGPKKSLKTAVDQLENAGGDFLLIEDLLDFSNEEIAGAIGSEDCTGDFPSHVPQNADSSTITAETASSTDRTLLSSSDSVRKGSHVSNDDHLQYNFYNPGADLCVPCDDLAELEWLSNFVEDSFSTGDAHREVSVLEANSSSHKAMHTSEILPVPGRARSKRSRAPVCNWVSRIVLSPSVNPSTNTLEHASTAVAAASSTDSGDALLQGGAAECMLIKKVSKKKKSVEKVLDDDHMISSAPQATRKCTHCATQKTPQWRAGPMGPKTLCNACGVRFKSGRLLPEYRPAASPTFVVSKHSNSHKKVLDIRRQKDNYYVKYDDGDDEQQPTEESLAQGLQDYGCSEDQPYFSHSADGCLFHNTRQDFI